MDLDKCIKQFVLSAARNAKYHSRQQKANPFIAKNAIEKEDRTKFFRYRSNIDFKSFFLFIFKILF